MEDHRYRVRDLMSTSVVTLSAGQSLPEARELMQLRRIRHLPVVDAAGSLVGLVTHRDLLAAAISSLAPLDAREADALQRKVPVERVMREQVWTIGPDDPADAAARLMLDNGVGCLPVLEQRQLVGIITEADLIEVAAIFLPMLKNPQAELLELSDLWTSSPLVLDASQPLTTAHDVMHAHRIRHLPVAMTG